MIRRTDVRYSFDMATRDPRTIKGRADSAIEERVRENVRVDIDDALTARIMNAIKVDSELLVSDITELALERDDFEVRVMLPSQWGKEDGFGGPPPDDPAMLYVCLNFKGDSADPVARWSIPLADVVADAVQLHACDEFDVDRDNLDSMRQKVEPENAGSLLAIRDRLREIADKIDQAIERDIGENHDQEEKSRA